MAKRWKTSYTMELRLKKSGSIEWQLIDPQHGGSVDYEWHIDNDRASAIEAIVAAFRADLLLVVPDE